MDARSLRVLEFAKILDRLASEASTSLGAAACQRLRPRTDPAWIERRLAETSEADTLLAQGSAPPLGGLTDIREVLDRARKVGALTESELLSVGDAAHCFTRLRAYYDRGSELAPRLWGVAKGLGDYRELAAAIEEVIDDEAQVRPDASPELRSLLREARRVEESLRSRLEAILRREAQRGTIQEPVIVQRAGRWCLAVQSSQQGRLQGILHDRSDSGATVFLEPSETVEMGNKLRETEIAIQQEIQRLLSELTAKVAARAGDLRRDLGTAAMLDMITCKARLADAMKANRPALRTDGYLELRRARHPLLRGDVVANDILVGRDFNTLVITGPNTGGKTVVLKTVGLLTLMAQAGLHIPAGPTSEVNVFDHIFADIGDEQSLEQSLSTFSSHMTQVVRIVNQVTSRRRAARRRAEQESSDEEAPDAAAAADSDGEEDGDEAPEPGSEADVASPAEPRVNALVLLDEIGAGTDPAEGSALARALLEELHEAGCRTLATTHYNELKAYAYQRKGMENASVEFDVKTLQPTYRLLIGHAGASNALEIAQRLGLPRRMVQLARRLLGRRGREVEQALRQIDRSRRQLDDRRREVEQVNAELDRLRADQAREVARLEEERRRLAERGYERARRIVAEADEEARRIIAELQRQPRQSKTTQRLRDQLTELAGRVEEEGDELSRPVAPAGSTAGEPGGKPAGSEGSGEEPAAQAEPSAPPPQPLRPGDRVVVKGSGRPGTVERVTDDGAATVRTGKLTLTLPVTDLAAAEEKVSEDAAALASRMRSRKLRTAPKEIHLRGMTTEEALHDLDKFLDDALLAGHAELRIVHGKGTGALRQAVHEWLKTQPEVRRFELAPMSEGGHGVTIVHL